MKIFGTGLQRTGTMSLTRALKRIGIETVQFPKELYYDLNAGVLNEYDGFTDFPIPLLYQQLDQAYPGSRFIHTIRKEQKWLESVEWLFTTGTIKFNTQNNQHAQEFHRQFYGTTQFDADLFLARYRKHNQAVKDYFADRPDDFLVINFEAGDGFPEICNFLGLEIPEAAFPHVNKSESTLKVVAQRRWRDSRVGLRRKWRRSGLRKSAQLLKRNFLPYPLQSDPDNLKCTPFFIVSTGRSGSTLLRTLILQNKSVSIPPESHMLGKVVDKYNGGIRKLPWEYVVRLVAAEFQSTHGFELWEMPLNKFYKSATKLPSEQRTLANLIEHFYLHYAKLHNPSATRWGDKSMYNIRYLPQLLQLFPQGNFIHIVRDGRDVAASLLAHEATATIRQAATYWQEQVQKAVEFGNRMGSDQYLEIRYEDLVAAPEATMRQVYDFIDLPFSAEMFNFWENVTEIAGTNRELHKNLRRPINTNAIGKWHTQLTTQQKEIANRLMKPTLEQLGYER